MMKKITLCGLILFGLIHCNGGSSDDGIDPSLEETGPIPEFLNSQGESVSSIDVTEPVIVTYQHEEIGANTKYLVSVISPSGTTVCENSIYSNSEGEIPPAAFCYLLEKDNQIYPNDGQINALVSSTASIESKYLLNRSLETGTYKLRLVDEASSTLIKESNFSVNANQTRLCASNSDGECGRSFLKTESNIYISLFEGEDLANGSEVDVYLINDRCSLGYSSNTVLQDITPDGANRMTITYSNGRFTSTSPLWTNPSFTGIYDIVIDVNKDGLYSEGDLIEGMDQTPEDRDFPNTLCSLGFTVQNEFDQETPVALQMAIDENRAYHDVFESEDVYIQVQSQQRLLPEFGVSKVIVAHQDEWVDGDSLSAIIDSTLDEVQIGSTNQQKRLIGPRALLSMGCYDLVFDVNQNGVYDAGIDAVDNLDLNGEATCGFYIPGTSDLEIVSVIDEAGTGIDVNEGFTIATTSKVEVNALVTGFSNEAKVSAYAFRGSQQGGSVPGTIVDGEINIPNLPLVSGMNTIRVLVTENVGESNEKIASVSTPVTWRPGGSDSEMDFSAVIDWLDYTDMDVHLIKPGGSYAGYGDGFNFTDCHYANCSEVDGIALDWSSSVETVVYTDEVTSEATARLDLDCIGCEAKTETIWIQDMLLVSPQGSAGEFLFCVNAYAGNDRPTAQVSLQGIAQLPLTPNQYLSAEDDNKNTWFVGYVSRSASGSLSWNAVNRVGGISTCSL